MQDSSVFQLERTPLHYAMGLEKVEPLSTILIKAGAKRVLKDLVSNYATLFYFESQFKGT
jgi:hypothetical protein